MQNEENSLSHFVDRQKLLLLATPKVGVEKIAPSKTPEI